MAQIMRRLTLVYWRGSLDSVQSIGCIEVIGLLGYCLCIHQMDVYWSLGYNVLRMLNDNRLALDYTPSRLW